MKQIIVDVVYGSYSQKGIKIYCHEDDDIETIKGIVKKQLSLNFLPMAYFSVKIVNTIK